MTETRDALPTKKEETPSHAPRTEHSRTLLADIRRSAKKRTERGKTGILIIVGVIVVIVLVGFSMRHIISGGVPSSGSFWTRLLGSPGDAAAPGKRTPDVPRSVGTGWKPIEIGPEPVQFNKDGIHPWDMDIPLGCIYVRLAKWAGGTEHGPYCGSRPTKAKTPRGAEWVRSADGKPFPAMYILYPN